MATIFAMLGAVAAFIAVLATASAFKPGGSDIQLILGGAYGIISAVLSVGSCILFRMDSKKDTPT